MLHKMYDPNLGPELNPKKYSCSFGLTEQESHWLYMLIRDQWPEDYPEDAKEFFDKMLRRLN